MKEWMRRKDRWKENWQQQLHSISYLGYIQRLIRYKLKPNVMRLNQEYVLHSQFPHFYGIVFDSTNNNRVGMQSPGIESAFKSCTRFIDPSIVLSVNCILKNVADRFFFQFEIFQYFFHRLFVLCMCKMWSFTHETKCEQCCQRSQKSEYEKKHTFKMKMINSFG